MLGDYFEHVGPSRGSTPSLLSADQKFAANNFDTNVPASIGKVYKKVRAYGKDSVLIFSTSQERYARSWGFSAAPMAINASSKRSDPRVAFTCCMKTPTPGYTHSIKADAS